MPDDWPFTWMCSPYVLRSTLPRKTHVANDNKTVDPIDQTPEERRIRTHFKSIKASSSYYRTGGLPQLYLQLARRWRRPVWEIKRIVKGHHIETGDKKK